MADHEGHVYLCVVQLAPSTLSAFGNDAGRAMAFEKEVALKDLVRAAAPQGEYDILEDDLSAQFHGAPTLRLTLVEREA